MLDGLTSYIKRDNEEGIGLGKLIRLRVPAKPGYCRLNGSIPLFLIAVVASFEARNAISRLKASSSLEPATTAKASTRADIGFRWSGTHGHADKGLGQVDVCFCDDSAPQLLGINRRHGGKILCRRHTASG